MKNSAQLTQLLNEWQSGAPDLVAPVFSAVYDELHCIARNQMRGQSVGHTLQATALINEAFIRMGEVKSQIENRGHFVGIVANLMRQILIDHARAKNSLKRGGGLNDLPLDEVAVSARDASSDVLALENVLLSLETRKPRLVRIAELVYFCGATTKEAAETLEVSESTIKRELKLLRALLAKSLSE